MAPSTDADTDEGYHSVVYVPLDEIVPADVNPKEHNGPLIQRMLSKFGMGELPLRDERTGKLVAGHGRLEGLQALHKAGKPRPRGIKLLDDGRWAMPMNTGWRSESDDHAKAYLLGSNQSTTAGGWDVAQLVEMLEEMDDVHMIDLTGFEQKELAEMQAALSDEDTGPTFGDADDDQLLPESRTVTIKCNTEMDQQEILQACLERGWDAAAVTK